MCLADVFLPMLDQSGSHDFGFEGSVGYGVRVRPSRARYPSVFLPCERCIPRCLFIDKVKDKLRDSPQQFPRPIFVFALPTLVSINIPRQV